MSRQPDQQTPPFRHYPELGGKTFLICVGAMKSATSWVYARLCEIPQVTVSPLKEVQFFNARFPKNSILDPDILAMRRLAYHIGQPGDAVENLRLRPAFQASLDRARMIYDDNAYLDHFARLARPETRVLADLTPAYAAIGADGFSYMRDLLASQDVSAKILFILRDPVDRLWSHLHFLRQLYPEFDPSRDWEKALGNPATLARSDYKGTIEALDNVFPHEDILLFFYETMFDTGFADLCARLNLAPPAFTGRRRENKTDGKLDLPDDLARTFHTLLAPQYEFCRSRIGSSLPAAWRWKF
jgi:hypothetical protein